MSAKLSPLKMLRRRDTTQVVAIILSITPTKAMNSGEVAHNFLPAASTRFPKVFSSRFFLPDRISSQQMTMYKIANESFIVFYMFFMVFLFAK